MTNPTPFSSIPADQATDVRWREWDAELFADPSVADQLRLLVIAPGWHPDLPRLEAALSSDERLARRLAADVTPVFVDADVRPDLAARYAEDDELTVAVLSPDGIPLARFQTPRAETLVEGIDAAQRRWRDERDELLAEREAERVIALAARPASGADLTPSVLDRALDRAAEANGLAGPERIRLWLYAHRRRADLDSERRARMSIQRRIDGGGFDHLSGGFRHCADPDPVCHVRLADDQGRWLFVLAGIAAEDSEAHEWVRDAVTQTIDFVEAELLNSNGGFRHGLDSERVLAASNAELARGLLACGIVFDRSDWRARGRTAVDFLVRRMRAGEAGFYRAWDGVPYHLGLLDDQVGTGQALLDAYESTGAIDYLHHAQAVARVLERQFLTSGGLLADVDLDHESAGLLDEPRFPPLQNAEAADLLIRLGHLTHDDRYVETAYAILGALAGDVETVDLEAACTVARVVDRVISLEPEVKIVAFAPPGEIDSIADPLHAEALRLALPAHTVQRLNPEFDDILVGQLGVPVTGGGAVCFVYGEYGALVTRAEELLPAIERAVALPA